MLIVFLAFLISIFTIGVTGSQQGQMEKVLAPLDGNGRFCGIKEDDRGYDYTEFKYLMFTGFDSGSVSE